MKKAKIILATLFFIAVIGGTVAFKTMRFNGFPAWLITNSITIGGVNYSTTATFCYTNTLSFISNTGFFVLTLTSTNTAPSTTVTLKNAAGTTFSAAFPPCVQIFTFITNAP
jgi:hypothetical protein